MPQSGNRLENKRSQDDKVSRRMWKAVETKAEKIRIAKTERKRGKRGSKKRARRKGKGEGGKTEKTIDIKRIAEEWEIWEEEKEAAKLEVEAKKLVPEKFHKWIKVFSKKQSEQMLIRKVWDHAIDVREGFVPRKGKVYPLSREEREEV